MNNAFPLVDFVAGTGHVSSAHEATMSPQRDEPL